MIRVATPGAQDSSAAGIALFRFREWSGFGHRATLTGGSQFAPVPAILFIFLVLGFIDINIDGPKVGKRPEAR